MPGQSSLADFALAGAAVMNGVRGYVSRMVVRQQIILDIDKLRELVSATGVDFTVEQLKEMVAAYFNVIKAQEPRITEIEVGQLSDGELEIFVTIKLFDEDKLPPPKADVLRDLATTILITRCPDLKD